MSTGIINYLRGETTSAVPPGMQVEKPSVVNCAVKAVADQAASRYDPDSAAFNSCHSCCNDYANYWSVDNKSGSGQTQSMKTSYLTHCLSHCRSIFGQN